MRAIEDENRKNNPENNNPDPVKAVYDLIEVDDDGE